MSDKRISVRLAGLTALLRTVDTGGFWSAELGITYPAGSSDPVADGAGADTTTFVNRVHAYIDEHLNRPDRTATEDRILREIRTAIDKAAASPAAPAAEPREGLRAALASDIEKAMRGGYVAELPTEAIAERLLEAGWTHPALASSMPLPADCSTPHCQREDGHAGRHRDAYGAWFAAAQPGTCEPGLDVRRLAVACRRVGLGDSQSSSLYAADIAREYALLAAADSAPPASEGLRRVHGNRHLVDDTREDCPDCWAAAASPAQVDPAPELPGVERP